MEKLVHPSSLHKLRRICFADFPPPNLFRAMELLGAVAQLEVSVDAEDGCLNVGYELGEHTLEALENHLSMHGFHLDNSLLHKIKRALIYYSESCQLENLHAPTREQRMRSIYLSSAHSVEHEPHTEPADEYPEHD